MVKRRTTGLSLTGVLALWAMCSASGAQALLLIDDFSQTQETSGSPLLVTSGAPLDASTSASSASILGNFRDMSLEWESGAESISSWVENDVVKYYEQGSTTGRVRLVWDGGTNGTGLGDGLGALDWTAGGNLGITFGIVQADLVEDVALFGYSGTGSANASLATTAVLVNNLSGTDTYFVPFSSFAIHAGTGVDWTQVTAFEVRLGSAVLGPTGTPGLDMQFDFLAAAPTPVPEPTSVGVLLLGLVPMWRRRRGH